MRTKPFSELRKQMTPEQRAESETRFKIALLNLTIAELHDKLLGGKQDDTNTELNDVESAVSNLENQDDIQVSTLSRRIKALGGSLKIVANFPNEEIVLAEFE